MKITKNENFAKYSKIVMPYLKNTQNQKYLTLFLTIGTSIFFILFAINPTISTIAKLKKEIADSKLLDQKMSEKINNLSNLNSAFPEIQSDISYITDAVPQKPDAPSLIGQVQQLAQESGVSIGNIVISPVNLTSSSLNAGSFNFTITIGGEFNDFSRFLEYLITMQRALTIDSVMINKAQADTRTVTATIKGSAYFKK